MELFIRLKNGQPFEHPISADNFKQAFPEVDLDNLPNWVVKFIRVEPPVNTLTGPYETLESSYQMVGDVFTDVWEKRPFTEAEKLEKQRVTKETWPNTEIGKRFVSWVFNEAKCTFEAPVAMPMDGKTYYWDETTLSWIEVTSAMVSP